MARTLWIVGGRKADACTLAANLDLARAIKLKRLAEIRAMVIEECSLEADDRALANATRKRWREADLEAHKLEAALRKVGRASRKAAREMAKPIYVYAQPYGGGHLLDREIRRFDSMFHPKRSFERKPDRLFSFHCKFTSRGFGDRRKDRSRVYRPGEAVKHLRYIIRELAREIANGGLVSNISMDPDELAGFFAALEELESHDRDNANVYMSLVVSLPHELTPEGRQRVLGEICALLADQGLAHVGVLHAPDPRGDQRNFHTHIMFSLRPCEIEAPGRYVFSPDKYSDLNDETFIYPFRLKVAAIFNAAMERENHLRRFTGLSDAGRGLEPRSRNSGKSTPGQKHYERKQEDLAAMQRERALVFRRGAALERLSARLSEMMRQPDRNRQQEIATRRAAVVAILQETQSSIARSASDRAQRLETIAAATLASGRRSLASLSERLTAAMPVRQPVASSEVSTGATSIKRQPDTGTEAVHPTVVYPVARTQPAVRQREPRGTDRRKSIAAAAWALRRATFPPQVRVGDSFSISPGSVSRFEKVDRFEAEQLIQDIHGRKRDQMLAAVRRAVEGMERSPFIEENGRARLPSAVFDRPLQSAVRLDYRDEDYLALITELHTYWRERQRAAHEEEAKKKREVDERRARLRHGIAKVLDAIEHEVSARRWPRAQVDSIRHHLSTIAQAISDGHMVMHKPSSGAYLRFESEGLRIIAATLADTSPGRAILKALAKLTLEEPLDAAVLPYVWVPPVHQVQKAVEIERDDRPLPLRGKDGPEI